MSLQAPAQQSAALQVEASTFSIRAHPIQSALASPGAISEASTPQLSPQRHTATAQTTTAILPTDSVQVMLTGMTQQLASLQAQTATPAAGGVQDQSDVIASQSASLASARQAMQLTVQMLESSLTAGASGETVQTAAETVQASSPEQAATGSMSALLQQLTQQLAEPTPAVFADQRELVASQAAQLALARQAMQAMVQLLEAGDPQSEAAASVQQISAHQQISSVNMPVEPRTSMHLTEQSMRAVLQDVLAQMTPQASVICAITGMCEHDQ